MRWRARPYPKLGDVRIKRFFAWLPVRRGNEVRWLEMVKLRQVYHVSKNGMDNYWCDGEFVRDYKNR